MRRLIVSVNILIERESVGNFVRSTFDDQKNIYTNLEMALNLILWATLIWTSVLPETQIRYESLTLSSVFGLYSLERESVAVQKWLFENE